MKNNWSVLYCSSDFVNSIHNSNFHILPAYSCSNYHWCSLPMKKNSYNRSSRLKKYKYSIRSSYRNSTICHLRHKWLNEILIANRFCFVFRFCIEYHNRSDYRHIRNLDCLSNFASRYKPDLAYNSVIAILLLLLFRYSRSMNRKSMNRSYRKLPMPPSWYRNRCWSSCHNSKTYHQRHKLPFWFELVYLFCFVYRYENRYGFDNRRYRTSDWSLYKHLNPYSFASTYKIRFASLPLSLFRYKMTNRSSSKICR